MMEESPAPASHPSAPTGAWRKLFPQGSGEIPHTAHGLLNAAKKRKKPTEVPLKLIVFIAELTVSCKSFYELAKETLGGLKSK